MADIVAEVAGHRVLWDPVEIAQRLDKDRVISIDTETTGLSPWRDRIALIQLYGDDTGTLGLVRVPDGIIPRPIVELFKNCIFGRRNTRFVVHNGVSFDIPMLHTHGVPWYGAKWYDTLVGESVVAVTGRRRVSVSLRSSIKRRLGLTINKDIAHGGWLNEELSPEQISYACSDVISLPALMRSQIEKAVESRQERALEMEMDLVPIVAMMTINGLPLVPEVLRRYLDEQRDVEIINRAKLYDMLGPINLGSHHQIKKAVRERYGLVMGSTAYEFLVEHVQAGDSLAEVCGALLAWRAPAQRLKMFSDSWIHEHIVAGYVHPKYWQAGTDTFRFACTDPNLQQTPRDGRKVYGNVDGLKVVSVDYSQIEVRIAAEVAHDEKLLELLNEEDVHRAIAAATYKISAESVEKEQRRRAKALVFTLLFGGTDSTLYEHSRHSGGSITREESVELERVFFETFLGLKHHRDKAIALARSPNPVIIRLPNGARRILVGRSKRHTVILNTMVQGAAAIGLKYGLLEADRRGLVKYLSGTVHDENVGVVPDREAEDYGNELSEAMIVGMHKVIKGRVATEIKIGDYWR